MADGGGRRLETPTKLLAREAGVSVVHRHRPPSKPQGKSFCVLFSKSTSPYLGVGEQKSPSEWKGFFLLAYRESKDMSSMADTSVEISPMLGAQWLTAD